MGEFVGPNATGPARINHGSAFHLAMLYDIFIKIYTNRTKCLVLMQNLLGFLLQFTETGYNNHN